MKRMSLLIGVLLLATPSFAQEVEQGTKNGELHGFEFSFNPYSYTQIGEVTAHGFSSGFAFHLSGGFAIAADFGLNKTFNGSQDFEVFSFRAGPRFTKRDGRTSIFGQVLLGGARLRELGPRVNGYRPSTGEYDWSGQVGGGIDIGARDWLSFRVIQAEYVGFYNPTTGYGHGARISTGLVFHLQ